MVNRISIPDHLIKGIVDLSSGETRHILDNICSILPKEITAQSLIYWSKTFQKDILKSNKVLLFETNWDFTDQQLRLIYACICCGLGKLNNAYGHFFDVMDRGYDYKKTTVAVSKTSEETSFHTDSTAKDYSPNIVGLLCLQSSKKGGESLLCNAESLWNFINSDHPEFVSILQKPIIRDVITRDTDQGSETLRIEENTIPIYEETTEGVRFRYMRYWIERAHEKLNKIIPEELIQAMDVIDDYFKNEENVVEFKMKRGEMLFINNHKIAHNRRRFEDNGLKRLLVRTWIDPMN